jgi:tetratricopeptide (TPR) repeat protein
MFIRVLRRSALFMILLATATTVHAGAQARIRGTVHDSQGNPVDGAVITITSDEVTDYEKVVKADKKGQFKVLILDATRNYIFTVEAPGFQAQQRPFKVAAGSTDNVFDFVLLSIQEAVAAGQAELHQQPGYKELEEAQELLRAGDNEGARAKFAEAVENLPDLLPALAGLAQLEYEAGNHAAALDAAKRCLAQDEESIECLAIAANACQSLGDLEGRAEYLARYEQLNPDDPTILFNSAVKFLNKMDDEGARPMLEKCLEADPNFPECLFEYGMLLLRSGDMEGAKSHLEKYIEVAPSGPDVATAQETIKYL